MEEGALQYGAPHRRRRRSRGNQAYTLLRQGPRLDPPRRQEVPH